MSNVAKIAVPILLLAAVGGGAYYFMNQADPTPLNRPGVTQPSDPTPKAPEQEPDAQPVRVEMPERQPERVAAQMTGDAHADAKQGISGRVLLPNGYPAAGVPILLVKNASGNPLEVFLNNQKGEVPPPLASSTTNEDGSFMLGLNNLSKPVDLRIISPEHPVVNRANLRVRSGEWNDLGDLRLKQGVVITGRVIDSRTKGAIAGTTVYMKPNATTGSMVAVPGHENGTVAVTDQNGLFRFVNGPRTGSISLTAEADGYASTILSNQRLATDAPNDFVVELERGHTITGVCIDHDGNRLPSVRVSAIGLSTKTPQNAEVSSDENGEFVFPTLHEGPYRLVAKSRRFEDTPYAMALTGDDVKIVMSSRGMVKLKVLAANRRPIKRYTVSLKRAFPQNPENIGNVFGHPDRTITAADYPRDYNGEFALIEGLPSGTYRYQITDDEHAKTLSPMFEIKVGDEPVEVVAEMTLGGVITGTVIDDQGAPVRNATVATDMNAGIAANIGLLDIFKTMIPEKHTVSSVRTDAQGRFKITRLSFADYMLRVSHPDFCEGNAIDIKLQSEGQQLDVGVIQLQLGATVSGVTTVGGLPTGQVEVRVSMPISNMAGAQNQPGEPTQLPKGQVLFSTKAFSGADGTFTLLKRVPPGTYEVSASRGAQNSPFDALMDIKHTKRELVVHPGQRHIDLNFELPPR